MKSKKPKKTKKASKSSKKKMMKAGKRPAKMAKSAKKTAKKTAKKMAKKPAKKAAKKTAKRSSKKMMKKTSAKKTTAPQMKTEHFLSVGQSAPDFQFQMDTGETTSLSSLRGSPVVLYFYPKDMTPGCTQQACEFQAKLPDLSEKGVTVLGISRDSMDSHESFKQKEGLTFPLVSDESGKICDAYGVWQEKSNYGKTSMGIVRTTYIIDADGKVQSVFKKVNVNGHVDEVVKTLSS